MTVKIFTGLTQVGNIANKFREAGIVVDIEGVENVYLDVKLYEIKGNFTARQWALHRLEETHGTKFNLK